MSSYFDEHDCEELGPGQTPDHMMHFARLLIDTGAWNEEAFSAMFADRPPPPTSKDFLRNLDDVVIDTDCHKDCPVCLGQLRRGDVAVKLPCKCKHLFCKSCIVTWLEKTSTCPACRHQLPTDDRDFEAMRRHEAREKQRQDDVENLHNSMFG